MSMGNSLGENILVIAPVHADRSGGSTKLGLSFDLMAKKKLQIDGLYYLPIVKT